MTTALIEAQAFLLNREDGRWQMVLVIEDGRTTASTELYATREECEAAFMRWCDSIDGEIHRIH